MIEIKKVHKKFGNKHVLKGIDLTINKGDKIAIIGPSGCGKSTLGRLLINLEPATEGEVLLNGESAWSVAIVQDYLVMECYKIGLKDIKKWVTI